MNSYSVLKKPIVSEKATSLNEIGNCVSFVVDSRANKIQIKNIMNNKFEIGNMMKDLRSKI